MVTALAVLVLSLFSGCTTSRPRPEQLPSLLSPLQRDSLAQLPPYLVPPPAGSSPRQVRQWQKAQARNLARAGHAPASVKIKNSTVATGENSTAVSTAKKSSTAVGEEASATRIDKAKAPVAVGSGAVATATTTRAFPWWVLAVVGVLLGLNRLVRGRWLL
ncbi:hypothetical protein SAMN02746009_03547 [Hymenobacter psychrotolerans DSM 18569]|uniref:Uncharacterized protein n=2 Tax=Hymenobacter psychrotolerans TaxID=344998 RepID=A0A1M7E814_9BACT|nr:hypothetical protein SAMN02746009_03547 [Hymenobacter psychrotolerans DSM 18569]